LTKRWSVPLLGDLQDTPVVTHAVVTADHTVVLDGSGEMDGLDARLLAELHRAPRQATAPIQTNQSKSLIGCGSRR